MFCYITLNINTMNKIGYTFIFGIVVLAFSCCGSSKLNNEKKLQQHPPFKITKAFYKTWFGGQPGVKGYSVHFEIDASTIVLDSVFFRNMSTKLERDTTASKNIYLGVFILPNRMKNYILHKDPKKEFGNELPVSLEKIPFELKANEAIISYKVANKTEYYKVSNVEEQISSQKL